MRALHKNKTLQTLILFLFAFTLLLSPISFSLTSGIHLATSYAGPGGYTGQNIEGQQGSVDACEWWCDGLLFLGNLLLTAASLIAGLGGALFDLAVDELVLHMSDWIVKGGIGQVIDETWGVVRDVVNLVFIFGFVYIGIRTILNTGGPNYRSFLAQLIIAALLINFSLFFTKVVIDVANVFAIEIDQLMPRDAGANIGTAFANEMGISGLYATVDPETLKQYTGDGSIAFFLMGALLLLIVGFVFAAAGVMIIIRFVALIFIMIFSPIYFASMVFPQASKFSGDIVKQLISYAFYAPVFLFLIYISLQVLQASTFGAGDNQLVDMLKNSAGGDPTDAKLDFFAVLLQFTVAITLVIASLRVAKAFSMWGGAAVVKTTEGALRNIQGYAGRAAGGATFGLAAGAARGTAGRWGLKTSESEELKEAASRKGVGGFVARRKLDLSRAAASASYDARQVAGVGKKLGIGEGSKQGFKEHREDIEKSRMKFAESLGEVKDDDTKVQAWQEKIDTSEDAIQGIKDEISATPNGPEKKALQGQLRFAEFELKNYQEALKYEKNRRQIGSAEANLTMATSMTEEERETLRRKYEGMAIAPTAEGKARQREELKKEREKIQERLKKERKDQSKKLLGYAGVLEASPIINFFRGGHTIPAGKAIRKKYDKKFKRSKEDERTERMVDSFKSSK